MKNIVMCSKNFEINGISSVITNLSEELDNREFNISFIFTGKMDLKYKQFCEKRRIKYYSLSDKKNLKFYYNMYKFLKKYKPEVLHIHGSSATIIMETIIAKIVKINKIILHSHNTSCSHPYIHKLMKPILNIMKIDRVACGEMAGRWMFGNKKFFVLKNGINTDKFKFDELARQEIIDKYNMKGKFIIGHIGEMNEQKNQKFLLEIFEKLASSNEEIELMLVGDGPNYEEINQMAKASKFSDRIFILGKVENIEKIYNSINLFIMPSLFEGLPLVLVEAQCNGIKCIVSSKVSKECNITNSVEFISLDNKDKWVKKIKNEIKEYKTISKRELKSKINIQKLKEEGYDINKNAKILMKIYNY